MFEYRYEIDDDEEDEALLDEILAVILAEPSIVRPSSIRDDEDGIIVAVELQTPYGTRSFPVKGDTEALMSRIVRLLCPCVRDRQGWIREVLSAALKEPVALPWHDEQRKRGAVEAENADSELDDGVFPDDDLLETDGMFEQPMFSSVADKVLTDEEKRADERIGHAARLLAAFARRTLENVWEREAAGQSSERHLENLGKRLDKRYQQCLTGLELALRPLLEETVRPPPSQRSKAVRDHIVEQIAQLLRQEAEMPALEADATAARIGILFELEKGELDMEDDMLADRVRKRRDRARERRQPA